MSANISRTLWAINSQSETDVSPAVNPSRQVEGGKVLASLGVLAVLAVCRRTWVVQISRVGGQEFLHVRATGLSGGWVENGILLVIALDINVPDDRNDQSTDEVVEWVEVVQPVSPESGDLGVWHEDTTEHDQNTDEQWVDQGGKDGVGSVGCNELT